MEIPIPIFDYRRIDDMFGAWYLNKVDEFRKQIKGKKFGAYVCLICGEVIKVVNCLTILRELCQKSCTDTYPVIYGTSSMAALNLLTVVLFSYLIFTAFQVHYFITYEDYHIYPGIMLFNISLVFFLQGLRPAIVCDNVQDAIGIGVWMTFIYSIIGLTAFDVLIIIQDDYYRFHSLNNVRINSYKEYIVSAEKKLVRAIGGFQFDGKEDTDIELKEEFCPIGYDTFEEGMRVGVLECGHQFKEDNLEEWFKKRLVCPVCSCKITQTFINPSKQYTRTR
jgi:hypothetical protein